MRYFDTGVTLKLYLKEPNSAHAISLVREPDALPPITALHRLEMRAAIGLKRGRGEMSEPELLAVLSSLDGDLDSGFYEEMSPSWEDVFRRAETLATAHASSTLCRSLDTLHVASALELGATEFCTFDRRQAALARAVGLTVVQ